MITIPDKDDAICFDRLGYVVRRVHSPPGGPFVALDQLVLHAVPNVTGHTQVVSCALTWSRSLRWWLRWQWEPPGRMGGRYVWRKKTRGNKRDLR